MLHKVAHASCPSPQSFPCPLPVVISLSLSLSISFPALSLSSLPVTHATNGLTPAAGLHMCSGHRRSSRVEPACLCDCVCERTEPYHTHVSVSIRPVSLSRSHSRKQVNSRCQPNDKIAFYRFTQVTRRHLTSNQRKIWPDDSLLTPQRRCGNV